MATATKPRRTKTRAPGVYRSVSGSYEIAYRDSDGRQVFRVVDGGFEDAKAARAEIVNKVKKGEPVRTNKQMFSEYADDVLSGLSVRPRTAEKHRYHLDAHLAPRFGRRRLADIRADDVAKLVTEMRRGVHFKRVDGRLVQSARKGGYAEWTISGVVSTLSLILSRAKRAGLIASNPVPDLVRDERPRIQKTDKRALNDSEIAALLKEAGMFRPLIAVLIFSGLRLGETLGLRWQDVGDGYLNVRKQLGRDRQLADIKTEAGRRQVVLVPQLASVLRAHRLASPYSLDEDFVFPSPDGRGRDHGTVQKSIRRAVKRAGLGDGVSAHSCRHTFASQLILAHQLDPVRVSKQLGHTSASFTADTYAHEFEKARYGDDLRDKMEAGFGTLLDVNDVSTSDRNSTQSEPEQAPAVRLAHG